MSSPSFAILRLDSRLHDRSGFDCGQPELNSYLWLTARQHMDRGYAQTWVAVPEPDAAEIAGYYSLSVTSVTPEALPRKAGIGRVPALLLGRLAVARHYQGQGVGGLLLSHAQRNAVFVSQRAGVHVLVVDALNEQAAGFYRKHGFRELTTGSLHLFQTVADIARLSLLDDE